MLSTYSAYMFFIYSNLCYALINWQLLASFLIHNLVTEMILVKLLYKVLYKIQKPKWLRSMIVLTLVLAEYIYKAIKRKRKLILLQWAKWQKMLNTTIIFILTK